MCDAYNAMTTDRVYRGAMSPTAALTELELNSGTQFDPATVEALGRVVDRGEPVVSHRRRGTRGCWPSLRPAPTTSSASSAA